MPIPLKKESDLPDELQFLWKTRRRSTSEAREPPPNASHPPTELNSTVPAIFAVIRAGVFFGRTLFRRRSAGARKKIESFKYDNYYQTEEIRKLDFAAGHLTGGGGGGAEGARVATRRNTLTLPYSCLRRHVHADCRDARIVGTADIVHVASCGSTTQKYL